MSSEESSLKSASTKRLRQACDSCHGAKTKCDGSSPCTRCQRSGDTCVYSQSNRAGRPKGTKNKKNSDGTKSSHSRSQSSSSGPAPNKHRGSYSEDSAPQLQQSQPDLGGFTFPDFGPSSLSSFASAMSSSPGSHMNLHGHHSNMSSIPFDFNPNHDFPTFTGGLQDNTMFQQDYSFPVMPNNMHVNMMDLCPRLSVDTGSGDMHSGMSMPLFPNTLTHPLNDADFMAISPSQVLRDSILQSIEQDDIPINMSSGTSSGLLSKVTTNTNSVDSKCSTNSNSSQGSPIMPQAWLAGNSTTVMQPSRDRRPSMDRLSNAFSPLLASNGDTLFDETRCQCLHCHAKLLTHLQELLKGLAELPVDTVLNGVEQGLKSWESFLQCRLCQQDQHREVLLLSAMSIRTVTRLLQGSSRRLFSQSRTADWLNSRDSRASNMNLLSHQRNAKLTLGSYEITGEEGLLVLGVVFSRVLAKIEVVLASLKQSLPSIGIEYGEQEADTYSMYLHALFQGLESDCHVLGAQLMRWRMDA